MSRLPMRAVPKPVKSEKKARKPLRAKSWGVSRSARGSSHRRRSREWGFMAWCHERGCELALDRDLQKLIGISHDCAFDPIEFAHLHDRRRHAPGDIGAGLDQATHRGIDGRLGGKLRWYVALEYTGQHMVRMRLANRARAAWDALTPEQREDFERRAEARRVAFSRSVRRP